MVPIEHPPAGLQGNPGLCPRRALVTAPRDLHSVHDHEHIRVVELQLDFEVVSINVHVSPTYPGEILVD